MARYCLIFELPGEEDLPDMNGYREPDGPLLTTPATRFDLRTGGAGLPVVTATWSPGSEVLFYRDHVPCGRLVAIVRDRKDEEPPDLAPASDSA